MPRRMRIKSVSEKTSLTKYQQLHFSGHQNSKEVENRVALKFTGCYSWEWLWACDNCDEKYSAMSSWVTFCPGCAHERCENCPLEPVKKRSYVVVGDASTKASNQAFRSTLPTEESSSTKRFMDSFTNCLSFNEDNKENELACSQKLSRRDSNAAEDKNGYINAPIKSQTNVETMKGNIQTQDCARNRLKASFNQVMHEIECIDAAFLSTMDDNIGLVAEVILYFHHLIGQHFAASLPMDSQKTSTHDDATDFAIKLRINSKPTHKERPQFPLEDRKRRGTDKSPPHNSKALPNRVLAPLNSKAPKRDLNPDDPDDPDDPKEPEDRSKRKKVKPDVRVPSKSFACHFQKRNPKKFHPKTDQIFKGCISSSIPELRRIVYHYRKAHRGLSCTRCFKRFQEPVHLVEHQRQVHPCIRGPDEDKEIIEDNEWRAIEQILRTKKSDEMKWREIWGVLFKGIDPPTIPWIEPPEKGVETSIDTETFTIRFETALKILVQQGKIDETCLEFVVPAARQTYEEKHILIEGHTKKPQDADASYQNDLYPGIFEEHAVGNLQSDTINPNYFDQTKWDLQATSEHHNHPDVPDTVSDRETQNLGIEFSSINSLNDSNEFVLSTAIPYSNQLTPEELNQYFLTPSDKGFMYQPMEAYNSLLSEPEYTNNIGTISHPVVPIVYDHWSGDVNTIHLPFTSRPSTMTGAGPHIQKYQSTGQYNFEEPNSLSSILEEELISSDIVGYYKNCKDRDKGL